MSDLTYFDYAATTPVDARVLAAMQPYFSEMFGNPSSVHRYGQRAEAAVEAARETVAAGLHCRPDELVFTSCGSESDNLALRGVALARRAGTGANRIVTSRAEHHAVSKTAEQLERYYGFQVDWLETDEYGMVSPARGRAGHPPGYGAGLGHGCQQRDRHAQPGCGNRRSLPGA